MQVVMVNTRLKDLVANTYMRMKHGHNPWKKYSLQGYFICPMTKKACEACFCVPSRVSLSLEWAQSVETKLSILDKHFPGLFSSLPQNIRSI